jgi:hypothetical protein
MKRGMAWTTVGAIIALVMLIVLIFSVSKAYGSGDSFFTQIGKLLGFGKKDPISIGSTQQYLKETSDDIGACAKAPVDSCRCSVRLGMQNPDYAMKFSGTSVQVVDNDAKTVGTAKTLPAAVCFLGTKGTLFKEVFETTDFEIRNTEENTFIGIEDYQRPTERIYSMMAIAGEEKHSIGGVIKDKGRVCFYSNDYYDLQRSKNNALDALKDCEVKV